MIAYLIALAGWAIVVLALLVYRSWFAEETEYKELKKAIGWAAFIGVNPLNFLIMGVLGFFVVLALILHFINKLTSILE